MHNEQLRDEEPIFPTPIADMVFIRQSLVDMIEKDRCAMDEISLQIDKDHACEFAKAWFNYMVEHWDGEQTPEQFYDEWMLNKG